MSNFDLEDEYYNPDIYTLVDEEGAELAFELLDTLEHNGQTYFALTPYYENPDDMLGDEADLVILKSEIDENDDELMVSIDDDDEYQEVGELFIEKLTEFFEQVIFDDE